MEGLKLAANYSWNCNIAQKAKICGKLLGFINNGEKPLLAEKILKALLPHKVYLLIAKANGIADEFSPDVVSFYWRGWPLTITPPQSDIPFFHNHAVFATAFKMPLEKINLEDLNKCLVHIGKIKHIGKNYFTVETRPIIRTKNRLKFGKEEEIDIMNYLRLSAKINDYAAFHFTNAAEIISPAETERLNEVTKHILQNFNTRLK